MVYYKNILFESLDAMKLFLVASELCPLVRIIPYSYISDYAANRIMDVAMIYLGYIEGD